jgi:hypothetical protein
MPSISWDSSVSNVNSCRLKIGARFSAQEYLLPLLRECVEIHHHTSNTPLRCGGTLQFIILQVAVRFMD